MALEYPLSSQAKRIGKGWLDCCPAHDDQTPSLSINLGADGKLLLHCFAGCSFAEIVAAAGLKKTASSRRQSSVTPEARDRQFVDQTRARHEYAYRAWEEGIPIAGTPSESYLAGRGIHSGTSMLRHHAGLWNSEQKLHCPALLAAVQLDGRFVGVHRTFLSERGSRLNKRMLGPCKGGAVQLRPYAGNLVVAEGIETTLSTISLCDRPGFGYWAALSAGNLTAIVLPKTPGTLVIAADGDITGLRAAEDLAKRARLAGWIATIKAAPEGKDWNDVLMEACHDAV